MVWLFVGFLAGLLTHRGYLKFIGWRRMRRFEEASYGLAYAIGESHRRELHDAAHRVYHRDCDLCDRFKAEDSTHGQADE